jgi:hypothetical protein
MRHCLHFRFLSLLLGVVVSFALAKSGPAQGTAVDRAQLTAAQAPFGPDVVGDHAVSSPNDADLGEQEILKRNDRYQPFTFSASVPFYWTSNVALVRSGEQDDFIIAPAVGVFYQPRITKTLYGLVGVREQMFYYNRFGSFNFGSFDAEAGLTYIVPQWHNLILRAEYDYNRLTDDNSFDDFFQNHQLIANAELPFQLGRAQQLSIGAGVNISLDAAPEQPRRHDYDAFLGYTAQITRSFTFDAVGRLVIRQYQLTDRVDVNEILALSANYRVTNWLTASAISTFAANQSNHNVFDYEVVNTGGAISLGIKF